MRLSQAMAHNQELVEAAGLLAEAEAAMAAEKVVLANAAAKARTADLIKVLLTDSPHECTGPRILCTPRP